MNIKVEPFTISDFYPPLVLFIIISGAIVGYKLIRKYLLTPCHGEELSLAILTIFPSYITFSGLSYVNFSRISIYSDKIIFCLVTGPKILITPDMVVGIPERKDCKIIIKFLYQGKIETIKASVCDSEGIVDTLIKWQQQNKQ